MVKKHKVIKEISAGGVVFRKKDDQIKILLLKNEKGLWVLPKGKIDLEESLHQTALREVCEETGLSEIKIITQLGKEHYFYRSYSRDKNLISKTVYYFLMESKKGHSIPQAEEGFLKACWFDCREALRQINYKESREILKKAINQLEVK
jgi:8-oxo-dGTP pyrophosphatase MutT (NUDIX family)